MLNAPSEHALPCPALPLYIQSIRSPLSLPLSQHVPVNGPKKAPPYVVCDVLRRGHSILDAPNSARPPPFSLPTSITASTADDDDDDGSSSSIIIVILNNSHTINHSSAIICTTARTIEIKIRLARLPTTQRDPLAPMALASPHALSPDIPGQSNGHGPASSYMHSNGSTNPYSSNYPLRGKLASPPPSHSNAHPRERSASIGYSETSELEPFDDSASVSEEYLGSHSTGDPQRDGWMAVPEAATSRDRLANASDDTTRGYSADVSPTTSHPGAAEGSKLSSRRLSMKSLKRENTYPPMSDEDVEARKVQEVSVSMPA